MLTLADCIELSELTPEEIAAIAEHEACDAAVAAELGTYLQLRPSGPPVIRRMIREDIEVAVRRGDHRHAAELKLVLKHYIEHHASAPGALGVPLG